MSNSNEIADQDIPQLPYLQRPAAAAAGGIAHLQHRLTPPTNPAPVRVTENDAPTPTPTTRSSLRRPPAVVDRTTVRRIRSAVSQKLVADGQTGISDQGKRAAAKLIDEQIEIFEQEQIRNGEEPFNAEGRASLAKAVFDDLFSLGPLQPLIDDKRIRNIHIAGADPVRVQLNNGTWEERPPIVDTDHELVSFMREITLREGAAARPWDPANPSLDMSISGAFARISAIMPPAATRPFMVIRLHRLVDANMQALIKLGTLNHSMAELLCTAQRAYLPMIIAGEPGAGKTTTVRALGNELPPEEPIVTIEEEYELFFDAFPDRHRYVVPLQTVAAGLEAETDGYNASQALRQALRMNSRRIFYGESHGGPEAMVMFRTMQKGVGAISTMHALSAADAIDGMIQMAIENSNGGTEFAYRMIARSVALVVHLHAYETPEGSKCRVTEIAQIVEGDNHRPIAHTLFTYDPETDTHHAAFRPVQDVRLQRMRLAGLNEAMFNGAGQ